MHLKILPLVAFLLIGYSLAANAQTVSVGWDDQCDYDVRVDANAINTALGDGNSIVRVSAAQDYLNAVLIEDSVTLAGGYADCTAANADIGPSTRTRIDGSGFQPSAIKIFSDGDIVSVFVSGFEVENATGADGGPGFNIAAGLALLHTAGHVELDNLVINDNHSEFWTGGIAIRNDLSAPAIQSLDVLITNVLVTNNTSGASGGGLTCIGDFSAVTVSISGQSGFSFNHSDFNGGGIHVDDCTVHLSGGTGSPGEGDPRGIHGNTSDGSGGGLSVNSEGFVTMTGNLTQPFNVTSNTANFDQSGSGDGGGIHLAGVGVILEGDGVRLSGNSTNRDGGGAFVDNEARLIMESTNRACTWNPLCGEVSANQASNGGAFHLEDGGRVDLVGAEVSANRANGGVVLMSQGTGNLARFESTLMHHNGDADHSAYSDINLLWNSLGDANISVEFSTLVDNDIQDFTISAYNGSDGSLTLHRSIVDDPGVPASSFVIPTPPLGSVYCSIVGDAANLAAISNSLVFEESPSFLDRAGQDYHLSEPPNQAMDQCQVSMGVNPSADLDGDARGFDMTAIADADGSFDIGVDEYVPGQSGGIFSSGFE